MFMYEATSTKFQDAMSMLVKVQVMHDMIAYNSTVNLGESYQEWLDKHAALVEDLIIMLELDIKEIEEPKEMSI